MYRGSSWRKFLSKKISFHKKISNLEPKVFGLLRNIFGRFVKTAFYVSRRIFWVTLIVLILKKFSSWLFFVLYEISFRFFGKKFKTWFSKSLFKSPEQTFWIIVFFSIKKFKSFSYFGQESFRNFGKKNGYASRICVLCLQKSFWGKEAVRKTIFRPINTLKFLSQRSRNLAKV